MRIERGLATLIAVLCGVLSAAGAPGPEWTPLDEGWSSNSSRVRRTPQAHYHPHRHPVQEEIAMESVGAWKRAKWQEMQTVLRREGSSKNGTSVECCPSVLEMVEPEGGRNERGLYVELFGEGADKQRFYEISCRQDVVNQPCRFVDPRLANQSRCVQQFSYTYALVRDDDAATEPPLRHRRERHFPALAGSGWSLDYIRVRSGCACEVAPPARKRKRPGPHRARRVRGKRPHEVAEDEDT